jgi:hypothetical protein
MRRTFTAALSFVRGLPVSLASLVKHSKLLRYNTRSIDAT